MAVTAPRLHQGFLAPPSATTEMAKAARTALDPQRSALDARLREMKQNDNPDPLALRATRQRLGSLTPEAREADGSDLVRTAQRACSADDALEGDGFWVLRDQSVVGVLAWRALKEAAGRPRALPRRLGLRVPLAGLLVRQLFPPLHAPIPQIA